MKKYFGSLLAVMMIAVVSVGVTSCGSHDDNGSKVSAYSYNQPFTIQNGVIRSNAFDGGGIVLTKLTDTKLEGYWAEYSGEKYYGVKRK